MPEVQAAVHVGVREGDHELFLGGAVLVELGLGLEDLVRLPALLGRPLHRGQPIPSRERLGLLCGGVGSGATARKEDRNMKTGEERVGNKGTGGQKQGQHVCVCR